MKIVLELILIFIAVTTVASAQVQPVENTLNCYAEHLKGQGLLEASFQSDPFEGDFKSCETIVTTASQMQNSAIRDKFKDIDSVKDSVDCIIERLMFVKFSDYQLLKEVLEETQLLSDGEKLEKSTEVSNILKTLSTDSVAYCVRIKDFRDTFDEMLAGDDEEDLIGDYCIRKYVLEKGLIDTNRYKVTVNPKNIKTENIKCSEIISSEFRQIEEGIRLHEASKMLKSKQIDCVISSYQKNDYFSRAMAVGVLGELELTEDQKQFEKERFLQSISNLSEQMSDCI